MSSSTPVTCQIMSNHRDLLNLLNSREQITVKYTESFIVSDHLLQYCSPTHVEIFDEPWYRIATPCWAESAKTTSSTQRLWPLTRYSELFRLGLETPTQGNPLMVSTHLKMSHQITLYSHLSRYLRSCTWNLKPVLRICYTSNPPTRFPCFGPQVLFNGSLRCFHTTSQSCCTWGDCVNNPGRS